MMAAWYLQGGSEVAGFWIYFEVPANGTEYKEKRMKDPQVFQGTGKVELPSTVSLFIQ